MSEGPLQIVVRSDGDEQEIAAAMRVMIAAFPPEYGEAWSMPQLSGMMRLPGSLLAVGRLDDKPVGFALLRSIAGESELLLLAVHPDHRGHNHGRRLLDRCMTEAESSGAQTMFLEVRAGNPAIHLYSKAGFRQYNQRRDYYVGSNGSRHDALSFKIILGHD
ncbi:GNAT family N-acetyltransferase [Sphingobium nicotianae]|uniref:GNAT family N-acetyltransferase n=1 Tax=Sphingobium nicotianae TaxID=2782607 RepID=A0A9X1DCH3_9SPHN|nr:GNAT family N-acetyltransferase [Sphingobium nicotianae]MBT2187585.1 GNAT family N-acetyltransferase [Sphingobium nicotianae]